MRGIRQGSVARAETTVAGYRPRRTGTSGRALIFLLVLVIIVVGAGVLIGIPAFRGFARGLANDNASALNYPFVGDSVRGQLGDELVNPMGVSDAVVQFSIATGDTTKQIAGGLADAGLIKEPMVFIYLVVTEGVSTQIKTGTFNLRQTMTPQQIVDRLQLAPDPAPVGVAVSLRQGLRIEQIAAYLQTLTTLNMNVKDWYDLVTNPPASLIADYPVLSNLPAGKSLEGFLGLGVVFTVPPNITPDAFTRMLLDEWAKDVGQSVIDQATAKHEKFYDVLKLASIVEKETPVDSEKVKVAGVYTNRLNGVLGNHLMNSEPTVIYANDTMKLRDMAFTDWPNFAFWGLTGYSDLSQVQVSQDLLGYQSWLTEGLPTTPIDSPSKSSILAAISPDTKGGYAYFYACPGWNTHVFAKTLAEQSHNIANCKPAPTPKPTPKVKPTPTP